MPARKTSPAEGLTRLARIRIKRGVTQEKLAEVTGISLRNLRRMEIGYTTNPKVRHIRNLAIALDVNFDQLLEPGMLLWTDLNHKCPKPPDIKKLHQPGKLVERPLWSD